MAIFTQSDLQNSVNNRIHQKIGTIGNSMSIINDGVREVLATKDLRSTKRMSRLAPDLFDNIWEYYWPSDAKGNKILGLQPQIGPRNKLLPWRLTYQEEFDLSKDTDKYMLSFSNDSGTNKLLASADVNNLSVTISPLDSLTANGSWTAFGDATNLSVDNYEYVKGSGSIKFDLSAAGGTTAGIVATNVSTFDMTNYISNGAVFVWAWITSTTNLTNYILRVGTNSSNYYSMTATTTNSGAAFSTGWNLLRFDFSGKSTTGTPTNITGNYVAVYMTKTAGKISETDYRFDQIIMQRGAIYNLWYYSRYLWQSSIGTWKSNATLTTDYLNVEEDEYNLLLEKCVEVCGLAAREYDDAKYASSKYEILSKSYTRQYPSEALLPTSTYYNLLHI